MAHLTAKDLNITKSVPEKAKIVVVGAGMSGLYSTWRLLNETDSDDIVILERSHRTGGRLDSDLIEFGDGDVVKEEEGGMRFTFDMMDDLMALFMDLDLSQYIVPFPMKSGGNNRLYFRGESFNNTEAAVDNYAIWSELYNLDPAEKGINPGSIINTVFNRILDVNPEFKCRPDIRSPEFWQDFRLHCKWKGIPLNEWSLWDLFTEMGYSNECITLLYRLLGFNGTFLSKMNAGVAYQLLEDFPSEPQFKTLEKGFSMLPNALAKRVNGQGQDRIFLQTTVESISDAEGEEGYVLSYSRIDADGSIIKGAVHAEKLILGLPRLALEKLYVKSDALNKLGDEKSRRLWDTLQTTSNQPLLKINLYYDKAWWGNSITGQPPIQFGPNFSDLPTGSVYPFYSIDEEAIAALEYEAWLKAHGKDVPADLQQKLADIDKRKYNKAAALTIYCDYLNINFWSALQNNGPLFDSPMQKKYTNMQPQTVFAASEAVVETATRFYKNLFNTHYVPRPTMTSARIWEGSTLFNEKPSQQFGYGVHQWALGANDCQVMQDMVEPLPNLHTCGEAYSDYQGWVEGALRSTDLVLQKAFGLALFSEVYKQKTGVSSSDAIKAAYQLNSTKLIRQYIDPEFDPDMAPSDIDAPDISEQVVCGSGIKLTYFDKTTKA